MKCKREIPAMEFIAVEDAAQAKKVLPEFLSKIGIHEFKIACSEETGWKPEIEIDGHLSILPCYVVESQEAPCLLLPESEFLKRYRAVE